MGGERVVGRVRVVGEEQHARAHRVELLGQPVEDGEREGVAEGVEEAVLDDDGDRACAALAQRARQRVGPGPAELGRGRAHPVAGGRATGPLPLKTSEAVLIETSARSATSRSVTLRV